MQESSQTHEPETTTHPEPLQKQILSVRELLQKSDLVIPPYQRPYKWTHRHINQLFSDIEYFRNKTSYRLGTIVFHHDGKKNNIVDGQQRTITLLLAIHALIKLRREKLERTDIKKQLDDLEHAMPTPTFESDISKANIRNNYLEIERIVSRAEFDEERIDFLLNRCKVVTFTLTDISEAFQFFDSQNARGRDLEPHDLLKAFHLREFSPEETHLKSETVARWEESETAELSNLFAQYLYRIRNWMKGESARYFSKEDTTLFKGVNIDLIQHFPYIEHLRLAHHYVDHYNASYDRKIDGNKMRFPFHLDQIILNGRRFFEMTAHYLGEIRWATEIGALRKRLGLEKRNGYAPKILEAMESYDGRNRTGDQYVRMIFDCLLIYYIDKFGLNEIGRAVEKIFIWAYSLRLKMQNVQLASVDHYVLEKNLFRQLKDATQPHDFLSGNLPRIEQVRSSKTQAIEDLFKEMRYYAEQN